MNITNTKLSCLIQHATQHVQQVAPGVVYYPAANSKTYYDAMVQKRRDVLKLVTFAVIIIVALSILSVVVFGFKEVILSNDFTFKQELGFRLIYPFAALFLLWNLKALTGR